MKLENDLIKQDELQLMIKIAHLHYQEGWLQRHISNELGLSAAKVSTLLNKALEKGFVEIRIRDPFAPLSELEERIRTEYGLTFVKVVPGPFPSNIALKSKLGLHAALFLQKIVRKENIVGITGGSTINGMVTADVFNTHIPVMVVPINGGVSQSDYHYTGNTHAEKLAKQLGGSYLQVPFPTFVSSPDTKSAVMKDKSAEVLLKQAGKADIMVLGIGTVCTSLLTLPHISREKEIKKLKDKGVVAEVGGHFLDKDGEFVQTDFMERLIGIEFEKIKQAPMVMAIAGGIKKSNAIHSALLSEVINALIIDEPTANRLINS
ncbi:sugar-binding transcriptional regulator [Oceanobacillus alkalisoli]|uniref:sugar-binding transcriptional regulator n=1 Tax=Oceanobacillus alkalisoli TaxID=2925113 RepID=UPI001EE40F25|nr:sugar-binding domain-containing protein [Oceanobacillus alkalisoli]MCG5102508.1 hypothetical protein [Oceanobacillus alkalisoli]